MTIEQKAPPAATVPEVRAGGRSDHPAGRIARLLRGEWWRRCARHPGDRCDVRGQPVRHGRTSRPLTR